MPKGIYKRTKHIIKSNKQLTSTCKSICLNKSSDNCKVCIYSDVKNEYNYFRSRG